MVMRHFGFLYAGLILIASRPVAAQSMDGWNLGLSVARESFTGAATDTVTVPGQRVEVTPTPRLNVEIAIDRSRGPWEFGLRAGYAGGSLRAKTDALILDDRSGGVNRWRMGLWVGRSIVTFQHATVSLLLGPGVERWSARGIGDHTTFGARAGLALRVPLGRLTLEHTASLGVSGTPFRRAALPAGATTRTMRTWSLGLGLRMHL
jgi:hypothetical protein